LWSIRNTEWEVGHEVAETIGMELTYGATSQRILLEKQWPKTHEYL
jgi:hypothetical protein